MPADHSIEWNCEEILMQKLAQTSALLASIDMRHHEKDASTNALTDVIIFKAEKGENQLEGVKGWGMSVLVTFASGILTAAEADAIAKDIGEAIYSEAAFAPDCPDLFFATIEPESTTDRTDTAKLRRRVVKVPMIAKLIS